MEKSANDLNISLEGQKEKESSLTTQEQQESINESEESEGEKGGMKKGTELNDNLLETKIVKDFELCGCKTQQELGLDEEDEKYENIAREKIKKVILEYFKDSACLKESSLSETGDNCVRISFSLAAALKAAYEGATDDKNGGGFTYDWSNVKSTLLSEAVAEIDRKRTMSKSCDEDTTKALGACADVEDTTTLMLAAQFNDNDKEHNKRTLEGDDEVFVNAESSPAPAVTESSGENQSESSGNKETASIEMDEESGSLQNCEENLGGDAAGSDVHPTNHETGAACENGSIHEEEGAANGTDLDCASAAEASFDLATRLSNLGLMNTSDDDDQQMDHFKIDLDSILNLPKYDPQTTQAHTMTKRIVSMQELSQRKDNQIEVHIIPSKTKELVNTKTSKHCCVESEKSLNPFTDFENTLAKHRDDEFCTFCSCPECSEYREVVIRIIVEQFKASHMVVLLLDALIKAYSPLLRNSVACKHFEKLLESNKEIYWIASGFLCDKKYDQLDIIYDDKLEDPMILVLFSTVLMVNNPMHLLHILAYYIECILKAFAMGISEVPADDKLAYIIDGYDRLSFISEKVGCFFFAFEKYFLRKFSLTWFLLCRRLYRQHVYLPLHRSVVAGTIPIKREDPCLKSFLEFDESMQEIDRRWNRVIWPKIQRYNLSAVECRRRQGLRDVHKLFDTVVQDAIVLSLQESSDENDFYSVHALENRRLAWQKIMAHTKTKWPDGFFQAPNTQICRNVCAKCGALLNEHEENCRCVTCCIAGGPTFGRKKCKNICEKCALLPTDKSDNNVQFFESKIVNLCTADDLKSKRSKTAATAEVDADHSPSPPAYEDLNFDLIPPPPDNSESEELWYDIYADEVYHIAWAVFPHLSQRQRYVFSKIDAKYFCDNCQVSACLLARKIIGNRICPELSMQLINHYQPLPIKRYALRDLFPNILLNNHKMLAAQQMFTDDDLDTKSTDPKMDLQKLVVKVYWVFIISLYGTYFIDFDDLNGQPINFDCLHIIDNDIAVRPDKLTGNPDDKKFAEFIETIRNFVPTKLESDSSNDFFQSEELQRKLDEFLELTDEDRELFEKKNRQTKTAASIYNLSTPRATQSGEISSVNSNDVSTSNVHNASQPKKVGTTKTKKCCVEHPELGEHCKENHNTKKRLKKECNHARVNETRDRLRKKLQNARKSQQLLQNVPTQQKAPNPIQQQPCGTAILQLPLPRNESVLQQVRQQQQRQRQIQQQIQEQTHQSSKTPNEIMSNSKPITRQPPSLKAVAAAASIKITNKKLSGVLKKDLNSDKVGSVAGNCIKQSTKEISEEDSLKCLNTLCKRIDSIDSVSKKHRDTSDIEPKIVKSSQVSVVKQAAASNCEHNRPENPPNKKSPSLDANDASSESPDTTGNNDFREAFNEIYEMLDKDKTKMNKWINETLDYIEGINKKKTQPQTANPKKAAKKAKQKMRKEEEKRIAELQEARAQFQDIYFKEFSEKLELKSLKSSKKRDKKKISELEANIKKLQRAKGNVETNILELIATVKQTNRDFKFSYLPTKEQQLDKIKELGRDSLPNAMPSNGSNEQFQYNSNDANMQSHLAHLPPQSAMNMQMPPDLINTFNYVGVAPPPPPSANVSGQPIAYQHIAPFPPFQLSFPPPPPPQNAIAYGLIRPPALAPGPICYTPAQLPPNVVAAMAANAAAHATADPKPIVTIRRVNIPNGPEPQVTISAKGTSPEQDKLLYTFVNGQLVPAGISTIPQSMQQHMTMGNHPPLPPEHVLDIPPPPLTKKQLKKERRRQAKALADALSNVPTVETDSAIVEEDTDLEYQKSQPSKISNAEISGKKQKKKKNKANQNSPALPETTPEEETAVTKVSKPKSLKTNDIVLADPKNSSKNSKQSKKKENKKQSKVEGQKTDKSKAALMNDTHRSSMSSTATSTKSTLTSDSETPQSTLANTRESSTASRKPSSSKTKQKANSKIKAAADTEHSNNIKSQKKDSEESKPLVKAATKKEKVKHKSIDKGQFDNNPWKTLHMQDSESDMDSSEMSSDDEVAEETVEQTPPEEITKNISKLKAQKATNVSNKKPEDTTDAVVPKSQKQKLSQQQKQSDNSSNSKNQVQQSKVPKKPNEKTAAIQKADEVGDENSVNGEKKNSKKSQKQKSSSTPTPVNQKTINKEDQQPTIVQNKKYSNSSTQVGSSSSHSNVSATASTRSDVVAKGKQNRNNAKDNKKSSNVIAATKQTAQPKAPQQMSRASQTVSPITASTKRAQRQNQRSKKSLSKHQQQSMDHNGQPSIATNYGSGIPEHMGYFNPNDIDVLQHQYLPKRKAPNQYENLTNKFQNLNLDGGRGGDMMSNMTKTSHNLAATNNSIMEQLNRGIQVENLSLPPGITLTKVDPAKSEALRQKTESINRLSKPLQTQTQPQAAFAHTYPMQPSASTIIAPPVMTSGNYMNTQYSNVLSGGGGGNGFEQNGIIMVEANPTANKTQKPNVAAAAAAAAASKTTSKSKRRRNKTKNDTAQAAAHSNSSSCGRGENEADKQPKMITLRNPMFRAGPANAAATMLQQPGLIGRPMGAMPLGAPLPVDQPAAIIKNENGMFTIRNPLLHQAVTNGLAMSGYGQFGSVNYYTPQEAAAEVARTARLQQEMREKEMLRKQDQQQQQQSTMKSPEFPESFSYFSSSVNEMPPQQREIASHVSSHNDISINCSSTDGGGNSRNMHGISEKNFNNAGGLFSDLQEGNGNIRYSPSAIARPETVMSTPSSSGSQPMKCISAIGSEIKQKSKEYQPWSNFTGSPTDQQLRCSTENLATCNSSLRGDFGEIKRSPNMSSGGSSQDQYKHGYYNGFDVFTSRGNSSSGNEQLLSCTGSRALNSASPSAHTGGNSLFGDCRGSHQMHHSCGDDSPPPPSLLSYSGTYLDGIPNTGVIKYDDASFLRNLIPGQNLNKEVSIHKVNESHFGRNVGNSPTNKNLVEITPIYASGGAGVGGKENSNIATNSAPSTPKDLSEVTAFHHQYSSQLGRSGRVISNESLASLSNTGGTGSGDGMGSFNCPQTNVDASVSPASCGVSPHSRSTKMSPAVNDFKIDAFNSFKFSDVNQSRRKNLMDLFGNCANSNTSQLSPDQQQQQQHQQQQQSSLLTNSSAQAQTSNNTQRTSPFLDEFVQNLNALQISGGSNACGTTTQSPEGLLSTSGGSSAGQGFLNTLNSHGNGGILYSNKSNGNGGHDINGPTSNMTTSTSNLHSNNTQGISNSNNNNNINANAWW